MAAASLASLSPSCYSRGAYAPREDCLLAMTTSVPTATQVATARRRFLGQSGWLDLAVLALILAVAAFTRLTFMGTVEFEDDEAKVAALAVAFLQGQALPLRGIVSSVGVTNPPAFIYLMSIPLAISRDPAIATFFIGLLGVGAVLLCYRLCEQYFDRCTAQVAASLFASAPWAVQFSRRMQAQDAVPFFTLLFASGLFAFANGKGNRYLVWAALWLSVLMQLHFAAGPLALLLLLAVALNWRRPSWHWVALAALVFGILWLPYLYFQLANGLPDLHAFARVMRAPAQMGLDHLEWLVGLASANAYFGLDFSFEPLYALEKALLIGGAALLMGRLFWTRGRAPGDRNRLLLALWLAIPALFFVRHSMRLYPHYMLIAFPVQFILMGQVVSAGERWLQARLESAWPPRLFSVSSCLLVSGLVASQVYSYITWIGIFSSGQMPPNYSLPLSYSHAAVSQAADLNERRQKPVYLTSNGKDYPAAFNYLGQGQVWFKLFDGHSSLVLPNDDAPTLYLVADPNQLAGQWLAARLSDRLVGSMPHPGAGGAFAYYRLQAGDSARLLESTCPQSLSASLTNGVRLRSYSLQSKVTAGQSPGFTLCWQVLASPPAGEDYAFFYQLVDDQGQKWGQVDAIGYSPIEWRPGDLVIASPPLKFKPDTPPGRYWLDVGMYRRRDVARVPIQLEDGSVSDKLHLGPIKVVAPAIEPLLPGHLQVAHFGEYADLLGYDVQGKAESGGSLEVTLIWQARQRPNEDYRSFVHLVDDAGKLVAQSDGQPGPWPTSLWDPGDRIQDSRPLALPAGLKPGGYRLLVGLYRADTLSRLMASGEGVEGGDHVVLSTPITVGSAR